MKIISSAVKPFLLISLTAVLFNCSGTTKKSTAEHKAEETKTAQEKQDTIYPSDAISFMDKWKIMLGNGTKVKKLINYQHKDFFYVTKEKNTNWIVYKTPNSGVTSKTSSNTRTELGQIERWTPQVGGKLTATLKVMHVSTSGDASVAASHSVVVGQIHSEQGHKNEPLKIFYKKFPGHKKGSIFWNYEINTEGENSRRWDFSTAVWGHDMSVIGSSPTTAPEEPQNGIELGEEFSYEIKVEKGMMYLTFISEGHETKTFTKNLLKTDYLASADIPQQIITLYAGLGRDGTEKANAYAGERQFFKLGAYNQTNGKDPKKNKIWCTGSNIYGGDIQKQYDNGSYTEVWFKEASLTSNASADTK